MEVVVSQSSPEIPSPDHPHLDDHHDQDPSNSIHDHLSTLSLDPPTDNNNSLEQTNTDHKLDNAGKEDHDEDEEIEKGLFPVRVGVEDCSFFVRTGTCKYGMNCKFNHPPHRKIQGFKVKGKDEPDGGAEDNVKGKDESSGKEGLIDCKYFDRPGGCKFGKACKFNHSRKSSGASQLNFLGLPIRQGEKECPYYMRNGSCKYGASCRFNHPDPASLGPDAMSGCSNGGPILSSNVAKSALGPWSPPALNGSPPYVPLVFSTQGVPSQIELNAYQAPLYPPAARSMNPPPAYGMNSQPLGRNLYAQQQTQILVDEFPERPGQPECSYFIKTGNCKYRSACKFHHPKTVIAKSAACTLSALGLPLRPGESVCSFYTRYGICKYGPACKYDHPINYVHQAPLTLAAVNQSPVLGNTVMNERAMAATS